MREFETLPKEAQQLFSYQGCYGEELLVNEDTGDLFTVVDRPAWGGNDRVGDEDPSRGLYHVWLGSTKVCCLLKLVETVDPAKIEQVLAETPGEFLYELAKAGEDLVKRAEFFDPMGLPPNSVFYYGMEFPENATVKKHLAFKKAYPEAFEEEYFEEEYIKPFVKEATK